MANWRRDIHYGLRLLARNRGFTAVAIWALALGIGPNTAIFSMVWGTLLAPLPYPQANRLVVVWTKIKGERNGSAAADYLAYRNQNHSFAHLDFIAWNELHLTARDGSVEAIAGSPITPGYWSKYLGEKMTLGRDFLPEETKPGNDREAILNHRLWQEHFHSDPHILGKQIFIDGQPYTVVGVLAKGPQDRDGGHFTVPLALTAASERQYWGNILGRLKPGVTLAQAQSDLSAINRRLAPTRPSNLPINVWTVGVEPLKNDWLGRNLARDLWLLLAAVGFILLIACVNVANLLLAKGAARQKEIAIRAAVGASRRQVFIQLLVESLTLAAAGGVVGIGLGWALMKVVLGLLPSGTLPSEAVVELNFPVLLFTVAVTLVAGVLFGCAPAWRAAKLDLSQMLKQGSRSVLGGGHMRTQGILVITEFALALTLLAGAGLALRSFSKLLRIDIGVHTDHVLTATLQAPKKKYSGPEAINASGRHLLQQLKATPGVLDAALTTNLPLEGYNIFPFQIAGRPVSKADQPAADFELVTPGYFDIFRVRLIKGRFLNDSDRLGSTPVVMVSDSFVHRYLPHVDPLSQRLLLPQLVSYGKLGPPAERQIVGVFHAIRNGVNLSDNPRPAIFASFWQNPWPNTAFVARTAIDPNLMIRTIGKVVASAVPGESLTHSETMMQIVGDRLTLYRFSMVLFAAFAVLALLLATLGIYGVMAFAVAQRGHEIGLRMALGAQTHDVMKLVVLNGMRLAGIGAVIGVAGVYTLGRLMRSTLYGVGSFDAISFGAVALILLGAALIACYIPACRSARVDPMDVLRQE